MPQEVCVSEPFLGEIRSFAFAFAPVGWVKCDGSQLPVAQNAALYSLIQNLFGGNQTQFNVPDLRGRVPVGSTAGTSNPPPPLIGYATGSKAGAETVTLTSANLPPHSHAVTVVADSGNAFVAAGNLISSAVPATVGSTASLDCYLDTGWTPDAQLNADTIAPYGDNGAHNNMQPFLVTNYCIATTGFYPPRN